MGVKRCLEFGAGCPQLESPTGHGIPWGKTDEDCLTLNIWTPAGSPREKLPVMVWIHGGAFVSGGSSFSLYNGANLCRKGVVVVTINYRLGPLGFTKFGNFGLLDQIAALQWVKRNIPAFGGNPDCLTLFGESAGAFCLLRLLISPLTTGLFHRAIAESGGYFGDRFWFPSRVSANESAEKAWRKIEPVKNGSPKEILEATHPGIPFLSNETPFGPIIDGYTIPKDPALIYRHGGQHDIPLIIGSNADEGSLFLEKIPWPLRSILNRVVTRMDFAGPAECIARSYQNRNSKAYLYRFTCVPPTISGKKLGCHHGAEVAYVFGNLDPAEGFTDEDQARSELIMNCWVNFAATGDPNRPGLPAWSAYEAKDRRIKIL
jgi:para-nitrobenzyl esterase